MSLKRRGLTERHDAAIGFVVENTDTMSGGWMSNLTDTISHLRRQYTLIGTMGSKCPYLANTRWMSMGQVVDWLYKNRIDVDAHYSATGGGQGHTSAVTPQTWVVIIGVRAIMQPVNLLITALQGRSIVVSEAQAALSQLIIDLCTLTEANGPVDPSAPTADPIAEGVCTSENFSLSIQSIEGVIREFGTFANDKLDLLIGQDRESTLKEIAKMV